MKHIINLFLIVSLFTFSSSLTAGKLYKWTDKDGKVHFSQTEPPQDKIKKIDAIHIKTHTPNKKDVERAERKLRNYKWEKEREKRTQDYKKRNEKYAIEREEQNRKRVERQKKWNKQYEKAVKEQCKKTRETHCNRGSAYIRQKALEKRRKLNDKRTIRYK